MSEKFKCEKCVYCGSLASVVTFNCYALPQIVERHCSTLPCIYYREVRNEKRDNQA